MRKCIYIFYFFYLFFYILCSFSLLDGCAHPHRKHQESAQVRGTLSVSSFSLPTSRGVPVSKRHNFEARQLRHKLLRGMMMGEEQITGMDDEVPKHAALEPFF